ncbi:MAG: hypothetical protein SFY67_09895 [Candidatus Melainabacteria bacterium]|nr:hypothetical protein [Candidatus Melainabacteria bacterium]
MSEIDANINKDMRIGDFLSALDIVSAKKLEMALRLVESHKLPIGKCLVAHGLVANDELPKLLELHGLLRKGKIDLEQAREAFALARKQGSSVRDALAHMGYDEILEKQNIRMGELLVSAELIDAGELESALDLQKLCGLPIGKILAIDLGVPQGLIDAVAKMQSQLQNDEISHEEAIEKLKRMPLEFISQRIELDTQISFLDLLVLGKILDSREAKTATNFAKKNELNIDTVVKSFNWLDYNLVSAISGLSLMLEFGYVTAHDATEFVKEKVHAQAREEDRISLYQFLLACGFLTEAKVRKLTRLMLSKLSDLGNIINLDLGPETPSDTVKEVIMDVYLKDEYLRKVLTDLYGSPKNLINCAQSMVNLINLYGTDLDKALLCLARERYKAYLPVLSK